MAFDWNPYLQNKSVYNMQQDTYSDQMQLPENFFFNQMEAPDGFGGWSPITNYRSPKTAVGGLTARDVVQKVMEQTGGGQQAGALLGRLINSGYMNQFADWGEIAPQIGEAVAQMQRSSDGGPGGLLKGASIHLGNMFEDWKKNPLAVGPITGKMFGGEASDWMGRPSDATYQEQGNRGVDVGTSQWMNNMGAMIGSAAAGAGLTNAFGMGSPYGADMSAAGGGSAPSTSMGGGMNGGSGGASVDFGSMPTGGGSSYGTGMPTSGGAPGMGGIANAGYQVGNQNYTSPQSQVQPVNLQSNDPFATNEFGGYTADPNYTPQSSNLLSANSSEPIISTYNGPTGSDWLTAQNLQTGLGLGGLAYQLYQTDQSNDALEDMRNQTGEQQFDYSQYAPMVDQYLNDPMGMLRNNPGYQASVDFLTKQERRRAAGQGFTSSGNIGSSIADVLGKNANQWYKDMWGPIQSAAGLNNNPAQLSTAQLGFQNAIDANKRQLRGDFVNLGVKAIPSLFKLFGGQ